MNFSDASLDIGDGNVLRKTVQIFSNRAGMLVIGEPSKQPCLDMISATLADVRINVSIFRDSSVDSTAKRAEISWFSDALE
jgi:hypothetical protein